MIPAVVELPLKVTDVGIDCVPVPASPTGRGLEWGGDVVVVTIASLRMERNCDAICAPRWFGLVHSFVSGLGIGGEFSDDKLALF